MIGPKLASLRVIDTQKRGDVFVHRAALVQKVARRNRAKRCVFQSMPIGATRFKDITP